MKVSELTRNYKRIFLDTAPVIYFAERHPEYHKIVKPIFQLIDVGEITAVTSVITLAECLVHPYLKGLLELQKDYYEIIVFSENVHFFIQNEWVGSESAKLRAKYQIELLDALQIATAIYASCDAFLTNDTELKRVQEIPILVVKELLP